MNPVALITGASRGIGRGIALELAKLGHDLVINYAGNIKAAHKTAADCIAAAQAAGKSIRAEICQADISMQAQRKAMVDFIKSEFRRLDLLVNNAGIAPTIRSDILEASEESFDRLMAVNVKGPYFLTQEVARWMMWQLQRQHSAKWNSRKERLRIQHHAYNPIIITISSISAYTASTTRGDYCISKAALSMLTPLFASRLADVGIKVFEIRPGIIATDMTKSVRGKYDKLLREGLTPIRRWGTPEDVGRAVGAISSNAFPFSTGEVINVDGGFHLRRL